MARSVPHRLARFGAALAAACLLAAAAAPQATLVFVTTTEDCPCTLDRCAAMRVEVDAFLKVARPKPRLEVVDLSKRPEAAKTYRAVVLPVAILQRATGEQAARFDGFFTEGDLLQAWTRQPATREPKR